MKNIYDIIKEQKEIVDFNMADRDLYYTIEYFQKNDYIEEGVGDGIKNLADKVVQFIKNIINKIKQFIRSFVNFFTGSGKDLEKKLNDQISEANKNREESGNSNNNNESIKDKMEQIEDIERKTNKMKDDLDDLQKRTDNINKKAEEIKNARKKADEESRNGFKSYRDNENTGKGTRLNDLQNILETSVMTVKTKRFGPLGYRKTYLDKIEDAYYATIKKCLDDLIKNRKVNAEEIYKEELFSFAEEDMSIIEQLKDDLGDSEDEIEFVIARRGNSIYEYIHDSYSVVRGFKKVEQDVTGELNRSIREVKNSINKDLIKFYGDLSSIVSSVFYYLTSSTMRAYRICAEVAVKATNKYCRFRGVEY